MSKDDKPTIQNSIIEYKDYYGNLYFKEDFISALKSIVLNTYNSDYAEKILNYLEKEEIKILNSNLFFHFFAPVENFDLPFFKISHSLKEYTQHFITRVKELTNFYASYIPISALFLNLAYMLETNMYTQEEVKDFLKIFVGITLETNSNNCNPFHLKILDCDLLKSISEIKYDSYKRIVLLYLQCIDEQSLLQGRFSYPTIEFCTSVYYSSNSIRIQYLTSALNVSVSEIKNFVYSVSDWDPYSTEIKTSLEFLKSKSRSKNADLSEILKRLCSITTNGQSFSIYNNADPLEKYVEKYKNNKKKVLKSKKVYVDKDFFTSCSLTPSTIFSINCEGKPSLKEIENKIEACYSLGVIRNKIRKEKKEKESYPIKIILESVYKPYMSLLTLLSEKETELFNRNLIKVEFEINYSPSVAEEIVTEGTDNIVVTSNVFFDRKLNNLEYAYGMRGLAKFNVFCGNAATNTKNTIKWLNGYLQNGIFTHGNLFCLNSFNTLQENIKILEKEFPLTSPLKYLNNKCVEYRDIIFLGSCLYTDFKNFPNMSQQEAMEYAKKVMPEFKKVKVNSINGKERLLDPLDYVDYYNESILYIQEKLLQYKGCPVVVLTHFPPLPEKSNNNKLYYSNNLSQLIEKNSIRVWCYGHSSQNIRYVFKDTFFITNPKYTFETRKLLTTITFMTSMEDIKSKEKWENILTPNATIKFFK